MPPFGVMFDHFHDTAVPAPAGSLDADGLRRMIDLVGRDRILPAREWIERARNRTLRDGDVCLTFDDNLRSQFDVAVPVLRELGLTACFFVHTSVLNGGIERLELYRRFRRSQFHTCEQFHEAFFEAIGGSRYGHRVRQAMLRYNPRGYLASFPFLDERERRFRFVRDDVLGPEAFCEVMDGMIADHGIDLFELARGLWMSPDQLFALHREGHVIGMHSHTHPLRLARLSPQQQRDEYTANWRMLRQLLGSPPVAMSHPCNSYSPYTLSILRQLGLWVGFRSDMPANVSDSGLEHSRQHVANLLLTRTAPAAAA